MYFHLLIWRLGYNGLIVVTGIIFRFLSSRSIEIGWIKYRLSLKGEGILSVQAYHLILWIVWKWTKTKVTLKSQTILKFLTFDFHWLDPVTTLSSILNDWGRDGDGDVSMWLEIFRLHDRDARDVDVGYLKTSPSSTSESLFTLK